MKTIGEVSPPLRPDGLSLPVVVEDRVRPPVEGGVVKITATWIGDYVASGLHDIDLATPWPNTIHRVRGQHPDGRPEPVTSRQLGNDLDTAIFDANFALGVDSGASDWRDEVPQSGVGVSNTGRCAGLRAGPIGSEVERVAIPHLARGDRCCLVRQGWDNVQALFICVDVGWVRRCPVKGTRAKAIQGDLVVPFALIELAPIEFVFIDQANLG